MIRWTVQQAAKRVGINTPTEFTARVRLSAGTATSLWHGRSSRVDLDTLQRVCEALQCTPNDLLGYGAEASDAESSTSSGFRYPGRVLQQAA